VPTESAQLHLSDPDHGDLVFDAVVAGAEDGEPVLLLHGWPQTALSWSRVIPPLASSGLRVAAVDQRGYSAGARPSVVSAYATSRLVSDAADLLDALGWGTAHVVGHDWGAIVGWELAARHPGLVRSLTALSVPHPQAFIGAIRSDPAQREKSAYMQFFRSEPAIAATVLTRDGGAALRQVYGDAVHEHDVEAYVDFFSQGDAMEASLRWYAAMDDGQLTTTPEVSVPTTFVWGDDDIAIGATAAHGCGRWCTGDYDFRELPGRGHWLPDQDPDAVVDAILARVG
jgi:pimeloyl-ACP methyl ester carboxylesterase